jgi:hypothetical protein
MELEVSGDEITPANNAFVMYLNDMKHGRRPNLMDLTRLAAWD